MPSGRIAVLDWRRRTAALYAAVRAEPDPTAAHGHWVVTRTEMLTTHDASPVPEAERATYRPAFAPYDPAWRFEVAVDTDVEPRRLEVPTGTDGVVPFERVGRLHLDAAGNLDVWWLASYGGGLFVPVKDALAGAAATPATYGGGRYLLDTVKGADLGGHGEGLVVDLNFAYNPSCAYDPAWACPLAPPGNRLRVAVAAGELFTDADAGRQ